MMNTQDGNDEFVVTEEGAEPGGNTGIYSVPREHLDRAIVAFPQSNLNRTMSNASSMRVPERTDRSDSVISESMINRIRALRSKFTERTEAIRAQTIHKAASDADESSSSSSSEGPTGATTGSHTEEQQRQFQSNLQERRKSKAQLLFNRHPGRRLVVRQPYCSGCIPSHRKPFFTVVADKPWIRIDGAVTPTVPTSNDTESEMDESPEIIGQEEIHLKEYACPIPAWLPTFDAIFLTCFSPYSLLYLFWLICLSLAIVYNFVTIPLREAFNIYDNHIYRRYWYVINTIADTTYLLDMLLVKPRIEYLDRGIIKFDVISVIPLDFFSFFYGEEKARFRILRLFKVNAFWDTFERLDQRLNAGFAVRLARTLIYMIFIIHLETCGYYAFNRWQGLNATSWSIPIGKISPYVYSFYVCMKTATSIGSLPAATHATEFMFMTCYWLSGIFVSAILIGQVIDILDSANANKVNYRRIMDSTLSCMHHLHAPTQVVNKVRTWFLYNWEQQKTFDENSLFECLPIKLKSDLAISVHFHTLSKVSLFQNCEQALIYDMVLKLKPVVFLPMDFICRKGEVGKEMYIVKSGTVEVVGGPDNSIVFVALKEGSVFGEISLLALSGKNRRTADVRSKGFSTLFSLSKEDFEEIMRNYPQAHHLLKKRSQRMLNRDKRKAKADEKAKREIEHADADGLSAEEIVEVISERPPTPRLMDTVFKALEAAGPEKPMMQQLRRRSARSAIECRRTSMRKYSLNPSVFGQLQSTHHLRQQQSDSSPPLDDQSTYEVKTQPIVFQVNPPSDQLSPFPNNSEESLLEVTKNTDVGVEEEISFQEVDNEDDEEGAGEDEVSLDPDHASKRWIERLQVSQHPWRRWKLKN